jgi:glycosyltransferase involved in cell wall biosynthesis
MRVLHVIPSLAPRHGGPTEAAIGEVRALRAQGIDASILTSDDDVGGALQVPLYRWIEYESVPVQFLPRVRARQHTLIGFTFAPSFWPWLKRNVSTYELIHVHTVFSFPANLAMYSARRFQVPYVVRPLGQLCRWSMQHRAWGKRAQLALLTRRNVDGAAFIHTTSRMEAVETAEIGFDTSCRVVPHGIDLPPVIPNARARLRDELGLPQERSLIAFMSRFHEKKGLEVLFEACSRLRNQPFDLVLAGTGEDSYVATLRQRAKELGIDARIHWYGFATGDRKRQLLQGADVFVLPSYSENFGIAVLEALACGLPVIVSDQVALGDVVTDESLGRVVANDGENLAQAIVELLHAPEERARIRDRALSVVSQRFSWSAAARQLIEAYREVISRSTAAVPKPPGQALFFPVERVEDRASGCGR